MWKRLQAPNRGSQKQIGHPVLVETTYDVDRLRNNPNVSDFQNATYYPHDQHTNDSHYPQGDLSPPTAYNRMSEVPTASSVYSQPSPEFRSDYRFAQVPRYGPVGISPPSSPEPDEQQPRNMDQPRRFRSMRDVSPIDESRGQDRHLPIPASNIPVLRKAPPSIREEVPPSAQKFWEGKVAPNSMVRWDDYSGEPTSSNAGKPQSVTPGSYPRDSALRSSDRGPMGYQVSVSGPQNSTKTALSERTERFSSRPSPVDTNIGKPREPWKGASGRTEIVQPFKDERAKQPLNSQRKSTLKQAAETTLVATVAKDFSEFQSHEDIKPIVPLKVGKNSPPRIIASPTVLRNPYNQQMASPTSLHSSSNQQAYSYTSPTTPTKDRRSASEAGDQAAGTGRTTPGLSTPESARVASNSLRATPASTVGNENGSTSRFSWTTYNTSTTYQQSAPPSPTPPLPTTTPTIPQEPIHAASSILNRTRPVPGSNKLPTRKPVSSSSLRPLTMASSDPPSPSAASTFSSNTQKALPRPPTEITAADHVDILEAQMADLHVRRSNVHRLLQDLNNAAPPNPLITDFKKMRLVERQKKEFEDELAEIKRTEHDVGLRMHRAWRKRERADPNGSDSAFWVRRVTR